MTTNIHSINLRTDERFGKRLPPFHVGRLMVELPLALRESISMALRNRSRVRGRRPAWLDQASDVRFVDHQNGDGVTLFFEAPSLGEAASEIYDQRSLFPESRPDPQDSGFDLLGDVFKDIQNQDSDSDHFDPPLLTRITRFQGVFKGGPFSELRINSRRHKSASPARCNPRVIESAKRLLGRTPAPQRVRLVGNLDGLEASTQRFSILLDSGDKATGVFVEDQITVMQKLWRQRVLVLGTAVYRASGRLLRIDAEQVKSGDEERSMFSQIPCPPHTKLDFSKLRKPQGNRSGMAAIMNHWPGDESDEQISQALEQLS